MKIFLQTLGLAAALIILPFAGMVQGQDTNNPDDGSVSFQTFYDQLASQGSWVQTDKYGYVFQPTETDPNWRPYTYGHWVNTEAGLTWVSDDAFGWATDHYGRWVNLDGYGWVWVPGYTWAPAWVSWRSGDDEVGWAPLPPDSDQGIDYYSDDDYFTDPDFYLSFHIGDDCDLAYGIGPWCYNFCPVAFIGDRDSWRHFRDRRDNFAFIGRTRNVTNINFRRDGASRFGHVRAEGPSVSALNAQTRNPIGEARLASASRLGEAGLRDRTLAVYAPRVDPATFRTSRPASAGRLSANATVNRGTDINHPVAVNSRTTPAGPTAEQIRSATLARQDSPSGARIATTDTPISHPLTQPVTSLRTQLRSALSGGANVTQNRFTGVSATQRATITQDAGSRFTGEPVRSQAASSFHSTPTYSSSQFYPPSSVVPSSPSAATYHSEPAFQSAAPIYRSSSAQVFHANAPAYHSQPSFHSFAPAAQSHFSSGNFRGGTPAAVHSGGGGGGAVHASVGSGQSGGRR